MGTLAKETKVLKCLVQSFIDDLRNIATALDQSTQDYRSSVAADSETVESKIPGQKLVSQVEEFVVQIKQTVEKASIEIIVEQITKLENSNETHAIPIGDPLPIESLDFETALSGFGIHGDDSDATIDNPLDNTTEKFEDTKEIPEANIKLEVPDVGEGAENNSGLASNLKRKFKPAYPKLRVKIKNRYKKKLKKRPRKTLKYEDYSEDSDDSQIPRKKTKRKQSDPKKSEKSLVDSDKIKNAANVSEPDEENDASSTEKVAFRKKRKYTKAQAHSRFRCKICVKAFSSKATLKLHIKTTKHLEKLNKLKEGIQDGLQDSNNSETSGLNLDDLSCAMEVDEKPRKHKNGESQIYECTLCGDRQNSRYLLKQHYLKTHPDDLDKNACDICKKPFPSEDDLKKHILKHKKKRTCELCDKTFSSTSRYRDHLGTLSHFRKKQEMALEKAEEGKDVEDDEEDENLMFPNASRICSICGQTFSSKTSLYNHVHAIHSTSKDFVCDICGKSWNCRAKLTAHIDTHLKRYKCGYCDDVFSRKRLRDSHQRIHTGETPFQCPHCNKSFREGYLLRKHVKTHSQVRPYSCAQCDAKFKIKGHLQRHEQQVHDSVKPHRCPLCPEAFGEKRMLQKHLYQHTGESDVKCHFCNKFLANLNSLNTHLATYHNQPLNSRALPIHNENSSKRFDSYKTEVSLASNLLNLSRTGADALGLQRPTTVSAETSDVAALRESQGLAKEIVALGAFVDQSLAQSSLQHTNPQQPQQQQQHPHQSLIANSKVTTTNGFTLNLSTGGVTETNDSSNPFFQQTLITNPSVVVSANVAGNEAANAIASNAAPPSIFAAPPHAHQLQGQVSAHQQPEAIAQFTIQVPHSVHNSDEATRAAVFAAAAQSDLMRPLLTVSMGSEAERNLFHYAYERQML